MEGKKLKPFDLTSMKIKESDYTKLLKNAPHFDKMISNFIFYLITEINEMLVLDEIYEIITKRSIRFSTFSFKTYNKQQFFTFCFENVCLVINISIQTNLNYVNKIFQKIATKKIHLISPNTSDYVTIESIIDGYEKLKQNLIFPSESEKEIIEYEMKQFIQSLHKDIFQIPLFNLSVDSLSTFMIRRFYFKTKYFENPDFFNYSSYKDENRIKIQEFKDDEFILLRDISSNTSLMFHKKTNHLVVQKFKKILINEEEFQKEKKFYNKINELKGTVKCFGYVKTKRNQVMSLTFEFMENGILQKFNFKDKKNFKYIISFQILEELNELHLNNIIHRDLKPDNIFINHDLNVFIGDFDSSRIFSDSFNLTHTLTKDIGFIYASPEMINSQSYTRSTDIYSFGLVLYFIFTGENPYQDLDDYEIYEIKNKSNFHHFSDKIYDESIKSIYLKCLKVNPEERPTTSNIINDFIEISFKSFYFDQCKLIFYILTNDDLYIKKSVLSIFEKKYKIEIHLSNILNILLKLLLINEEVGPAIFGVIQKKLIELIHQNNPSANYALGWLQFYNTTPYIADSLYNLKIAAENNIIDAHFVLADLYKGNKFVQKDINKVIYYYQKASDLNYLPAHLILGNLYYNADLVERNINKSIHYFSLAADQNDVDAQYMLGLIFYQNMYIERDIDKAIKYFTLAADQNDSYSQNILGNIYYDDRFIKRDINKAIYYLTLSANQQNSSAQLSLGIIYKEGKYVKSDINKALYYLTLSANQQNASAQLALGIIYKEGKYVKSNINKAIYYLTLSANQQNAEAQLSLGFIYKEGKYVKSNINKAIYYLTLSSNQQNSEAQLQLSLIYYNNESELHDIAKSFYYLDLSANRNNQIAQYILGVSYLDDPYIKHDIEKAFFWLTKSANNNFQKAHLMLAYLYYHGKYTKKDINKSIEHLIILSKMNNSDAQFFLGCIYLYEKSIIRDCDKAIYYLNLSAKQNNELALVLLGKNYYEGLYFPRDLNKAMHYLFLAAKQNSRTSLYLLGLIYSSHKDGLYNINEAIHYFNLSANLGDPDSQYSLGSLYFYGKEVKHDFEKAKKYFEMASRNGNAKAQFTLGFIYFNGIEIEKNVKKGIKLMTISANQKFTIPCLYLGKVYLNDSNLFDIEKAIHYLTISSENNSEEAQKILGEVFYSNQYVSRDIKKAIHYFKESSSFNNPDAKNYLGIIYKNGEGVDKNIYHAITYFNEAINKKNNECALYNLARIFYFGIDIEKNVSESIKLLNMAFNMNFIPAAIFLFFIYKFGDENINCEKEEEIKKKILNDFLENNDEILYVMNIQDSSREKLFKFFYEFDLVSFNENFFLKNILSFVQNGSFFKQKNETKKCTKVDIIEDINEFFYEGLDIEIF